MLELRRTDCAGKGLGRHGRLQEGRQLAVPTLHEELKAYLAAVGTTLPTHNPDYDPTADEALISVTRPPPAPGTPPGRFAPSE